MPRRHPDWLKVSIPGGKNYAYVTSRLKKYGLNTVCSQARCPNLAECYGSRTATFLLLGTTCTRGCRYCNIGSGRPLPPDEHEPEHVARAVADLGLRYVVITSVTRDDLPDGGAGRFAHTVREIRRINPDIGIELLIPDFKGSHRALLTVIHSRPLVLAHNIEVARALFRRLRPRGNYGRSLRMLSRIRRIDPGITVKSGFMIGLGETITQVKQTLGDLKRHGVQVVSMGQYLQPGKEHPPVRHYYTPGDFRMLKEYALGLGFGHVEASPLTRSSYHAEHALCV
jgi:lipoic acid synthetase